MGKDEVTENAKEEYISQNRREKCNVYLIAVLGKRKAIIK